MFINCSFYSLFRMVSADLKELEAKIEAILFSYGEWVSISELMDILGVDSELLVKNALEEVVSKFKDGFSFEVVFEDTKYRMVLRKEYEQIVEDLVSGIEIPPKALKVLSVIAYEQPVTKTRLSEILGRYVKEEVDYLHRNKFISYEKKGIGKYYKVTKKFYEYFNIEEEDFREKANKSITTYFEEYDDLKDKVDNEISE